MRSITRHTGIITDIQRMKQLSSNGNPRYTFMLDGYKVITAVDSSHAYEVPNLLGQKVTATIGSHYGRLTLNTIEEH